MDYKDLKKGFTLLEILLVIAAIGVLAAIVIVAINPNRQLAQTRDAERWSEVNSLAKSLEQYLIDTGSYPTGITTIPQEVCAPGGSADCIDLSGDLVPTYLAQIPEDSQASGDGSGYTVFINSSNSKIAVDSSLAEIEESISVNIGSFAYDGYDIVMGYSLRRLKASYDGPLVRIRRTSDDTEQDFGFDDEGNLDEASLVAFLAGSEGHVVTWYDQSGNAHDAVTTVQSNQPKITDGSGSLSIQNSRPAITFDPTSNADEDELFVSGFSFSGFDMYVALNLLNNQRNDINESDVVHLSDGGSDGYRPIRYRYSSDSYNHVVFTTGSPTFSSFVSTNKDFNIYYTSMYDGSQTLGFNGTDIISTTLSPLQGLPVNQMYIGDDATGDDPAWMLVTEMVFFDEDTSTIRSDIEATINDYYSVY